MVRMQVSDFDAGERFSPTDRHTQKVAARVSAQIYHVQAQLKLAIPAVIAHCLVRPLPSVYAVQSKASASGCCTRDFPHPLGTLPHKGLS